MGNFEEHRITIRILFAGMEAGEVAKVIADGYERMEYLERLEEWHKVGAN